jgi:glycine/D-amino acid oxidase-like deaminating enzyme
MPASRKTIVVGSGIFGVTAALELARRGHAVTLMDTGRVPHVRAASTDISKIVRMDYGADHFYTRLMIEAFVAWDRWNREWNEPLYHPDGFLLLTQAAMRPGDLEYDSFQLLQELGYAPQRLGSETLRSKYPAWKADKYLDGYFNPHAGWAESGRVVQHLAEDAVSAGVAVRENLSVVAICDEGGRVSGVQASDGARYPAETVVVAAGTWSPLLSPRLKEVITHTAHPVFHLLPDMAQLYRPPAFPVWSADIAKTGWYGFPVNRDGILKISNHGPGRIGHPDDDRTTTPEDEMRLRDFLRESLPALAPAPIADSKTCFYSDSWDGNFYIDKDPDLPGLVYATGGSGHGFKFAPVLGALVADVVEGKPNSYAKHFAWRPRSAEARKEQARYRG